MSSCQDLLSLSLWGMLTVAWGFQGNYFDCSFMIQTQGMFTALPSRCILCTGIKSYRIGKVQDFLLISLHFPRPLPYQRLRSSFSCCLPSSWVMLWKKLQLHFGLFFWIWEEKYLSRLAWGMCGFISVFCEQCQRQWHFFRSVCE